MTAYVRKVSNSLSISAHRATMILGRMEADLGRRKFEVEHPMCHSQYLSEVKDSGLRGFRGTCGRPAGLKRNVGEFRGRRGGAVVGGPRGAGISKGRPWGT